MASNWRNFYKANFKNVIDLTFFKLKGKIDLIIVIIVVLTKLFPTTCTLFSFDLLSHCWFKTDIFVAVFCHKSVLTSYCIFLAKKVNVAVVVVVVVDVIVVVVVLVFFEKPVDEMFFVSSNAKGTSYHVIPLPICFWFDPRKSLRNTFYLIKNELLI